MIFATQEASLSSRDVRVDTLDGRDYVVAPVVAVREMVLKDKLLPASEIEASAGSFNGRPLPVGHPTNAAGEFVSANTRDHWETAVVGFTFNMAYDAEDAALTGEVWIDIEKSKRLAETDPTLGLPLAMVASHLPATQQAAVDAPDFVGTDSSLEVSTAYWYNERPEAGTFAGQSYSGVQSAVRPDHLALLPTERGECSVADGCGVRSNSTDSDSVEGNDADDAFTPTPPAHESPMTPPADAPGFTARVKHSLIEMGFAANCECGCDSCPTMAQHTLKDRLGLSDAAFDALSDDDIARLTALADASEDPDATDDPDGDVADEQPPEHEVPSGDDETDDEADVEAIAAVEALTAQVEALEAKLTAQESAERDEFVSTITAHTELSEDALAKLDLADLEALAAQYQSADLTGRRTGAMGAPASDERVEQFAGLVSRMRNGTEEGDN